MKNPLQNMIDLFTNGLLETQNLQISNENFLDEIICNERLFSSSFKNASLLNLNFTNVDFGSSFFQNCIFDRTSLQEAEFKNCSLINCRIRNCNLSKVDFTETTFDKCCFEKIEKGSLVKGWFESCHFLETNFNGFEKVTLIQTAVVDSKFSKFNKSIEFKGEFFLIDILSYFERLQTSHPIATYFSDGSFKSYVIFPYVELKKRFEKYWCIEIAIAEQLYTFPYPFGFPKSFLCSQHKNDLRLKVRLIQSLVVKDQKKTFDLEELFNQVSVSSSRMVQIKKEFGKLLKELVQQKLIQPEL